MRFEAAHFHFLSDISVAVAFVVAWATYLLRTTHTWGVDCTNDSVAMGTVSGSIRLWRLKSSVGTDLGGGPSKLLVLVSTGLGSDSVKDGGFWQKAIQN